LDEAWFEFEPNEIEEKADSMKIAITKTTSSPFILPFLLIYFHRSSILPFGISLLG